MGGSFKSCENFGGSLATLPSIKDANRLLEMMKLWGNTDSNGHYWVGAKVTESGVGWGWKWLSGEAVPKPGENDQGYSWDKGGIEYAVGNCLLNKITSEDFVEVINATENISTYVNIEIKRSMQTLNNVLFSKNLNGHMGAGM